MSDTPNDGGPAFPIPLDDFADYASHPARGMSLRDWFAGQALGGLVNFGYTDSWDDNDSAKHAYMLADAMLSERDKRCTTR